MSEYLSPEKQLQSLTGKRVLLLGIGNPLRGDDGAGAELARRLLARGKGGVIEAGEVPENYLGRIRAYCPEIIILADAARLGGARGPWELLNREELLSLPSATHGLSPSVVMEFLERTTGAEVLLLGIGADKCRWGTGLSHRGKKTLVELEGLFLDLLPE